MYLPVNMTRYLLADIEEMGINDIEEINQIKKQIADNII